MSIALLRIFGIILFLYLSWRSSRENHEEEKLITFSWAVLLMFLIGGRVTYGLINWGIWNESFADWISFWTKPGFDYLGAYATFTVTALWLGNLYGFKVWGLMEDLVNSILLMMTFCFLDESLRSRWDLKNLTITLSVLLTMILANLIRNKYRGMVWYKSGKKGFVYFFSNFIGFMMLAGLTLWFNDGAGLIALYVVLSLISLSGLFILGDVFEPIFVSLKRKK
ncbi:MAG TPA: hypothetical protein VF828_04545 [Patescibacteria group bacterium]